MQTTAIAKRILKHRIEHNQEIEIKVHYHEERGEFSLWIDILSLRGNEHNLVFLNDWQELDEFYNSWGILSSHYKITDNKNIASLLAGLFGYHNMENELYYLLTQVKN